MENAPVLIWKRVYKAGYVLKKERHFMGGEECEMVSAYTLDGAYIGSPRNAYWLVVKRGIVPELIDSTYTTCTIGFNEKQQKWYGWSHRAIYGFGIGAVVKKGSCTAEYIRVGFEAKTLKDCKKLAIAMANSVS